MPSRQAFTLTELLVVILVMMLVAGITLGALAGFRQGTRLVVAEQLLSDLIRQARHTARSSGTPVILRITEATGEDGRVVGGEIAGIIQTPLFDESFENDAKWQDPRDRDTDGRQLSASGRTGHGLRIKLTGSPEAPIVDWPKGEKSLGLNYTADDRSKRLIRGTRQPEGFYLAASVYVPALTVATNHHLPVVAVGLSTNPQLDDTLTGLMLRRHQRPLQRVEKDPDGIDSEGKRMTDKRPLLETWEILGWVSNGTGTRVMVSSIDDQSGPAEPLHSSTAKWSDFAMLAKDPLTGTTWENISRDIPIDLPGDRWLELGLLFDGRSVVLYLDGSPINRREAAVQLPPSEAYDTVWVGAMGIPTFTAYPESGKKIYASAAAIIDDVRLLRLGSAMPGRLPQGVRPWTATANAWYELTALPDGRTLLDLVQTVDQATTSQRCPALVLAEVSDPAFLSNPRAQPEKRLDLTVNANGTITSNLVQNAPVQPVTP